MVRTLTEIGVPPFGRRGARPARREECADRESASLLDESLAPPLTGCIGGHNGTFISVGVLRPTAVNHDHESTAVLNRGPGAGGVREDDGNDDRRMGDRVGGGGGVPITHTSA